MKISLLISLSILLLYTCCLLITTTLSFKHGNQTDRLALLAIKAKITQDPLGTLSSWNDSFHFCEWEGVTCGRRHRRVTILGLPSQRLVGSISPHVGNLSFLRLLDLRNNSFHGDIPQEVGRLFRLNGLALRDNSLEGEIPINVSRCLNLILLGLSNNRLTGKVPVELGSLSKLTALSLSSNNLSGSIPSSLGNLSSLTSLALRYNSLEGSIPVDLGKLTSLSLIDLSANNLSGMVPSSLYNLSLLGNLSLTRNQLQGSLPFDVGLTLPNLKYFSVILNKFTGRIPVSFSNSSGLETLLLADNNFVGSVPNNFGNLQNLNWLVVSSNNLGGGDLAVNDLSFLTYLTNCSNLKRLYMEDNDFRGMLPSSIGNLSTKLGDLLVGTNQIYGTIPTGIQNLLGLTRLGLENNMFTGSIPKGIGKLQNLGAVTLVGNRLTGLIPSSLGNLTRLIALYLDNNQLSGRIPASLGKCKYLLSLSLSQNHLNGTIPKEVIGLSSLSLFLDLSNNSLSGSLPLEVGNLNNLRELALYENKLSGEIPHTLGECSSLELLSLDGNLFQGNIPSSLTLLKALEDLSLSRNNLSGLIPKGFEKLPALLRLNLSFNNFEGNVPTEGVFKNLSGISVIGNSKLCGGIPQLQLRKCSMEVSETQRKSLPLKVIILIVVGIVLIALTISVALIIYWKKSSKRKPSTVSNVNNSYLDMVSYNELLKATDGFSSSNLLGVGSFGSVYKAIIHQDEKPVAVKVLNLEQRGATNSFISECNALRNVRHRNLLKIITACSSTDFQGNDFKALVFEFMPNGSLENWLYPINAEDQPPLRNLSFERRLSIAIDVASALDYLHHQCETPLVHRDLKPSNVLLDDDLTAHVGDFGLAKFLVKSSSSSGQNEQTNSAAIKGSIGYVAPEYGMGSEVSTRGDVYSYGILLLEMITGRRPTDDIFKDGLSLHIFCRTALSTDAILEIVDSRLLSEVVGGDASDETNHSSNVRNGSRDTRREKLPECLGSIVRIGLACSAELPVDRMSMDDVVVELRVLKDLFLEIETHGYKRMSY